MRVHFEGDTDRLRTMGEQVMANPGMLDDLASNPKSFLGQFGLDIDDATARAIQMQTQREKRPSLPAGTIHVDL
jgi:hypothetical protein